MKIINASVSYIDYETNSVDKKSVDNTFDQYLEDLIINFRDNKSTRKFNSISLQTEVVSSVMKIIKNDGQNIEDFIDNISQRLLREEIKVQERISKLGVKVQKGSLIQALAKDDNGNYLYVIAKVEHESFVDDKDYSFKSGFSKDKHKIWKTCIFRDFDNALQLAADVFLNNKANYWHEEFLEIKEFRSDEVNTQSAYKAVDALLRKEVKKISERDYFILTNSFCGQLKNKETLDYPEAIDQLITNYFPDDIAVDIDQLRINLLSLPDKHGFDNSFFPVPEKLGRNITRTYQVNDNIELKIKGYVEVNTIQVERGSNGQSKLIIETDNEKILDTFSSK